MIRPPPKPPPFPSPPPSRSLLHCPADPTAGEPGLEESPKDPNLPISYLYEMSLEKGAPGLLLGPGPSGESAKDRKSTRLNSSHLVISYAVFCLKKKITTRVHAPARAATADLQRAGHCRRSSAGIRDQPGQPPPTPPARYEQADPGGARRHPHHC